MSESERFLFSETLENWDIDAYITNIEDIGPWYYVVPADYYDKLQAENAKLKKALKVATGFLELADESYIKKGEYLGRVMSEWDKPSTYRLYLNEIEEILEGK